MDVERLSKKPFDFIGLDPPFHISSVPPAIDQDFFVGWSFSSPAANTSAADADADPPGFFQSDLDEKRLEHAEFRHVSRP
jgi:hypothetical protein